MLNILAYADDIVLICPSWRGLECLLNLLSVNLCAIDMVANPTKTVCMVFPPRKRTNIVSAAFPKLQLGSDKLEFVDTFKYLGHRIVSSNKDDSDIQRELSNLFTRTNILLRRFSKCSKNVKVTLFKSYCLCMYDTALWKCYNAGTISKLRSGYNKCIKIFFGLNRRDSMTNALIQLGLPSFDTVLVNAAFSFQRQSRLCSNKLVQQLLVIR